MYYARFIEDRCECIVALHTNLERAKNRAEIFLDNHETDSVYLFSHTEQPIIGYQALYLNEMGEVVSVLAEGCVLSIEEAKSLLEDRREKGYVVFPIRYFLQKFE